MASDKGALLNALSPLIVNLALCVAYPDDRFFAFLAGASLGLFMCRLLDVKRG